jgi:hypothetical protein
VWDLVFRTYRRPDTIRVPRRLAMVWLLDDTGQVRAAYAADYEIVGRAAVADLEERDRSDAFANRPPVLA